MVIKLFNKFLSLIGLRVHAEVRPRQKLEV